MELIANLPIATDSGFLPVVGGITHDSRRVEPGDLFVAVAGEHFDGRAFAGQAAERGAAAVLGAGPPPAGLDLPWLETEEPRSLLGPLAARLHDHPDRELAMVAVTGTNGKSTVVELVRSMLDAAGRPSASIGTLGYRFGELISSSERTTPEASDLFRMLRAMRDAGAEAAAMEVSSHALGLSRVAGLTFDAAVFTNLSRDHFDFHPDIEQYFATKKRLFRQLKEGGRAVVNVGDSYGRRLAGELPEAFTFGQGGDVRAEDVTLDEGGIRGRLETPVGPLPFHSGLLGTYNLENIVAAAAAGVALGVELSALHRALAESRPLAGRLEPVVVGQPFPVFVDYAHTDAALASAIRSVRELTGRKVLVVFGCGGDRDPGKRTLMGRAAGSLADRVIATSDNPRTEDPAAILASVAEGLRASGAERFVIELDRRAAIRTAVEQSDASWAVLVAGKGHEEVQVIGDQALPFSDRVELTAALEERFGAGTAP